MMNISIYIVSLILFILEFDAFGNDILKPMSNGSNVLKPQNTGINENKAQSGAKILSTDLDSTLASLADNLDIKSKGFQ